jgi:hypothetical protein
MEFSFFVSYELYTIKGGALRELVKCKSLKPISKPKFLGIPNISRFLAGFQKPKLDKFGPAPPPQRLSPSQTYLAPIPGSRK